MQTKDYPAVPDDLGHWLAGFIDGEGTFAIQPNTSAGHSMRCQMQLVLRDDDRPILEQLALQTGMGRVYDYPRSGTEKPRAAWIVYRRDDCAALARLLDRCPLRAKKAAHYAPWRQAVQLWSSVRSRGSATAAARNRPVWDEMARLKHELESVRAYRPPAP